MPEMLVSQCWKSDKIDLGFRSRRGSSAGSMPKYNQSIVSESRPIQLPGVAKMILDYLSNFVNGQTNRPVSYTHLTLPTIYSV